MRSSKEEFLTFCIQSKQKSSLVWIEVLTDWVSSVYLEGRVALARLDAFTVEGRGCKITLDLSEAEDFDRRRPKDSRKVTLRVNDPEWPSRPLWSIVLPDEAGLLLLGEMPPKLDAILKKLNRD